MSENLKQSVQAIAERITSAEFSEREMRCRMMILREIMERHPCPNRESFLWYLNKAIDDPAGFARVAKKFIGVK